MTKVILSGKPFNEQLQGYYALYTKAAEIYVDNVFLNEVNKFIKDPEKKMQLSHMHLIKSGEFRVADEEQVKAIIQVFVPHIDLYGDEREDFLNSAKIAREAAAVRQFITENGVSANSFLERIRKQGYNAGPVDIENIFKELKALLPPDLPNDEMRIIKTPHGDVRVIFHLIANERTLLADPEQLQTYFLGKHQNSDIGVPQVLLGNVLEEYVGNGGNNFLEFLLDNYRIAKGFSKSALARDLGVSRNSFCIWTNEIRPNTLSRIASTHGLSDNQAYLLQKLGRASIRDTSVSDLLNEAKEKLAALNWRDDTEEVMNGERAKRNKICGELLHSLAKVTGVSRGNISDKMKVTPKAVNYWYQSFNPIKEIDRMDILGELFAGGKGPLATEITDTLLGLPERKSPKKLLEELTSGNLSIKNLALQARLQKRHSDKQFRTMLGIDTLDRMGPGRIPRLANYIGLESDEDKRAFMDFLMKTRRIISR